jgi:mono/diheme cytochrome c family protein
MASLHVFISHFAIGGGAFLAFTEHLAYKRNDQRLYDWIKTHAKFFLLITTVLGTVTGVGIWWAIGLVSPNGTSLLLQNFSLFWAAEWILFLVELVTFFVWYYTLGRIPKKTHLQIAWAYFGVSFFTLFVINGILTFMLTNGTWAVDGNILSGYFNQGFIPSLFIRLFIMFGIAGVYALVSAARLPKTDELRPYLFQYSAKWMLPAVTLAPLFVLWYLFALPDGTQQVILSGLSTMGEGNFSVLARAIFMTLVFAVSLFGMTLVGPYLNPKGFSMSFALVMLATMFGFMLNEEWSREMMRKPYVIYDYMYSNGLPKKNIQQVNNDGFFASAKFANAERQNLVGASQEDVGRLVFRYQCMSCHVEKGNGYRSMQRLLGERDEQAISSLLTLMRDNNKPDSPYHGYMPPFVGTQEEQAALATYLATLNRKPDGAAPAHPEAMATVGLPKPNVQ